MKVAAIMPCRGRAEQTVRNVKRLLTTAGYGDWQLTLVVDGDPNLYADLGTALPPNVDLICSVEWSFNPPKQRVGYWQSLKAGSDYQIHGCTHLRTGEPCISHIVNLANDLLPGQHWLSRAVAAYQATFGDGPGLLGFNGDSHETEHSCHFLISRALLDDYGGWPVWYDHNYGDTELCQRAIADGLYAKAPWSTLFHDHPYFGGDDDVVYAEGRTNAEKDRLLYEDRRMRGWPTSR